MRYTQEQRDLVEMYYATCETPEKKLWLCRLANIKDIRRLYNLSHQMGLTRYGEDLSDAEFNEYMAGNHQVIQQRKRFSEQDERELRSQRDDPASPPFSEENDKFLISNFHRMRTKDIALNRRMSETAVLYRARQLARQEMVEEDGKQVLKELPLRLPAQGYLLSCVAGWLGMEESQVEELSELGVEVRPLLNKRYETVEKWVIARSLASFFRAYGARLIENGADAFFIMEILETEEQLERGETEQEACYFLDHGHDCQNPWAGPFYRLACDGKDPRCRVFDLRW